MENLAEENYPREFNLIEVLSIAWSVFTKNYFKLFGFIFALAFPIALANTLYFKPIMENFQLQMNSMANNPSGMIRLIMDFFSGSDFLIMLFTISIVSTILFGTIVGAVKSILFENEFVPIQIVLNAIKRLPKVIIAAFILGFILVFGFMLLFIPGIIALVYFYFAIMSIYAENATIWGAFERSKDLVKGRFLMTFVFIILFVILNLIVNLTLNIFGLFSNALVYTVVLSLVYGIASVYFIIVQYVLFVNYRDTAHFYRPQIIQE